MILAFMRQRLFAYCDRPGELLPPSQVEAARLIVARDPDGVVKAAAWDMDGMRTKARQWLGYGLQLELVTRDVVQQLMAAAPTHIFGTRQPVGDVLTFEQAQAAFGRS